MEGLRPLSFPDPGQQATIRVLGNAADDAVLLSGRAGGQTILQGVTIEGGLVVNDLGADVDTRFEGDAEPNLLYLDAGADSGLGRVGIGTAMPANRFHVRGSSAPELVLGQFENAGGGGVQFRLTTSARTWALRQTTAALSFRDATGAVEPLTLVNGAANNSIRVEAAGIGLFGVGSFGGGVGVVFLANRTTAPSSAPVGGLCLWSTSGRLACGTSGLVTGWIPMGSGIKVTAGAPFANDGYLEVFMGGTLHRLMTTA